MIHIDQKGSLTPLDGNDLRLLLDHAGDWNATAVGTDLLVFRRHVEGRPADAGVLLGGEIRKSGWLIEIFSFISNVRLTGTLIIMEKQGKRRDFFFESGMLKLASSSVSSDLFGELAVSEGVISREQLANALSTQTKGTKLGQILLEQGLIKAQDIHDLLCKKIEKIFNDGVIIEEGVYYFLTGDDLPKLPGSISIDTHALLLDAARRIDEHRHFGKERNNEDQ
ncbi:MAG: hypothetical protein MUF22_08395 [Chitinispirillaceae bacterium]|jgi:hypothetical protein|nr:hypothetical protein [Chitinispirillaceae bacterium]